MKPSTTPEAIQPDWMADRNFIPLPSDPAELTIEHVRSAFAGDWSALKDVVKVAKEVKRAQTIQPVLSTE